MPSPTLKTNYVAEGLGLLTSQYQRARPFNPVTNNTLAVSSSLAPWAAAGVASSVFNANSFTGCLFWYDPTDTSKVAVSGSSITGVTDKGPNGYNLAPTATAPTVRSTAINAQQTFRFINTGGLSTTLPTIASAFHFFAIAKFDGTGPNYQEFCYVTGGSSLQLYVALNTEIGAQWGSTEIDGMITSVASNTPYLIDYAVNVSALTITATLTSAGGGSSTSGSTSFAGGGGSFGGSTASLPYYGNGPIADFGDMVAYSAIKTGTELSTIRSQLRAKWGL